MKNIILVLAISSFGAACGGMEDPTLGESEDAVTTGVPTLTLNAGYWGPLVVNGAGFNDERQTLQVQLYDQNWALIATHTVTPAGEHCNVKGYCWGGGTFSTSFSVTEVGNTRHAYCETVHVYACDPYYGCTSATTFLPSCIN